MTDSKDSSIRLEELLVSLRQDNTRMSVTSADCSYGTLNDDGVEALVSELTRSSNGVVALYLAGNQIGDRGATAFARYLRSPTTLRTLDVSDNQITDVGANALLDAVTWNSSVLNIFIGGNAVSNAVKTALNTIVLPRTEKERKLKAIGDVVQALKSSQQGLREVNFGGNG
jgi:Leucine-rich repeat (LRR) protein